MGTRILKYMRKQDIEIVFFHELGHYFAHRLNAILYDTEEVQEVNLIEKGFDIYEGTTHIKWKVPLCESLPQRLAALVYGCIFQGIAINNPNFNTCFDFHNKYVKGLQDAYNISSNLTGCFKKDKQNEVCVLFEEYFSSLFEKNEIFKKISEINYSVFLQKTNKGYSLNLKKLEIVISPFYEIHKGRYRNFVSDIDHILN